MFIVQLHFRKQSYEAAKHTYQVQFPDAAVPNKSTRFRNVNRFRKTVSTGDKRRAGCIMSTTGRRTFSKLKTAILHH